MPPERIEPFDLQLILSVRARAGQACEGPSGPPLLLPDCPPLGGWGDRRGEFFAYRSVEGGYPSTRQTTQQWDRAARGCDTLAGLPPPPGEESSLALLLFRQTTACRAFTYCASIAGTDHGNTDAQAAKGGPPCWPAAFRAVPLCGSQDSACHRTYHKAAASFLRTWAKTSTTAGVENQRFCPHQAGWEATKSYCGGATRWAAHRWDPSPLLLLLPARRCLARCSSV